MNRLWLALCVAACSPTIPEVTCAADADCGEGLVCADGTCLSARLERAAGCRSDETLPCGPMAVGRCKRGIRRCISGVFENECRGAVTGTDETCNGLDDDCDGEVDEGVKTLSWADRDGDGFGSPAEPTAACEVSQGFVTNDEDCSDGEPNINPSRAERCETSGVDDDCDGLFDEGCGCTSPGQSHPCCAGRGTQACQATDGGAVLTTCTVTAGPEVCNGVDDDCDGQTDEQFALGLDAGFAGGTFELDGGCVVGLGACARVGVTTCAHGELRCSVVAGAPSPETCNASDDDCDGETDEAPASLCAVSGQVCEAGTCACPIGTTPCGARCEPIGSGCAAGTGACRREGTVLCTNGAPTCDAVAGTPSNEVCNTLDDDCDGQADEAAPTLCAVSGQRCGGGACACLPGQAVCGATCQAVGGTCSTGVGACRRTGITVCAAGSVVCNAVVGNPVTETCNTVDDDCDGQADEGLTVSCLPDGDGDGYATSLNGTELCPDPSRTSAGRCPVGFVSASASAGIDCAPNNPLQLRQVQTRADHDADFFCVGSAITECVGTLLPLGRTPASSCAASPDCNDANAATFRSVVVRNDVDADGFCSGADQPVCVGNTLPTGTRLATTCSGVDCNDTNASAATACNLLTAFSSTSATHTCGTFIAATVTRQVSASASCPPNFRLENVRAEKVSGAGSCAIMVQNGTVSVSYVTLSCTGFDGVECRLVGDCRAN